MSQSGYTPIQLYRTTTAAATPTAGNLAAGELAINLTDEKLYFKNAGGTVKLLASTDTLGTVTSVAASGGTTGLTFSGSPITTSGTLTLGGTLGVANGGTGTTTAFTAGSVVFAGASGVYTQDNANLFWDNTNDRLGIGTATPGSALQVNGDTRLSNGTGFATGNSLIRSIQSMSGSSNQFVSNSIDFYTAAFTDNGQIAFSTGTVERMRIDGSGNVGIGTTSPAYRFDVRSGATATAIYANSTATTAYSATSYNGTGARVFLVGGNSSGATNGIQFTQGGSSELFFGGVQEAGGAASFVFQGYNGSAYAERMRIDSSGNVGIGTTAPGSKLSVVGTINASDGTNGNIRAYVDGTSAYLQSLNQAANAYRPLLVMGSTVSFANDGVTNMILDTNGNLQLGPSAAFSIAGTKMSITSPAATNTYVSIYGGAGSTNGGLLLGGNNAENFANVFWNTGSNLLQIAATPVSSAIKFDTAGSERFRITSTGGITSSDLADAVGYKGMPQNSQTSSYTLALSDMGKHISITTGGVVIPANGSVAFPIGATIVVFNNSGSSQTISITTDTLRLAGSATTGSRTLAQYGLATLVKVTSTVWVATGNVT
jgi:hypothetical protein